MISVLINTIYSCKDILLTIFYCVLSIVISTIFTLFLLTVIKTLRPVFALARQKKKTGDNPFKKKRHKRLVEKDTRTIQRIKLSKDGICYRIGDYNLSPAVYDLLLRPAFGLLSAAICFLICREFSAVLLIMVFYGYIGIPLVLKRRGKQDERQIEWDIYKALTNIRLQLACGAYMEDCLKMAAKGAIHPRFREAMDELMRNMADKSMTAADSIEILKTRFSSERTMTFCKILDSMITYGSMDSVCDDMNKELDDMIQTSTGRSVEDIRRRYQFSSGWMSMVIFILVLMYFNLLFSDNEVINSGVTKAVLSFNDALGGKIF
ncbi:MAG: hypothetical protein IKO10_16265 [Lachnospiraceae bacterium]|nr:hypothetical protein [Lachnospiraceae bacterium]